MSEQDAPLVWITRAEPGATRTASRLADLGYAPLVAPMIVTRPLPSDAPAASTYDLLAFTSAAGVAAFAEALGDSLPSVPVFTVGDATAKAARQAGFAEVRSAKGDGHALSTLIAAETPEQTRVLHPAAAHPAFDLAAALRRQGRDARSLPVYETRPVDALPTAARLAFDRGALRAVLIHSPAAGRALAALRPAFQEAVVLVALSAACADPLEALGTRTVIAAAPNEAALLMALDALRLHTAPDASADHLGKPAPRR